MPLPKRKESSGETVIKNPTFTLFSSAYQIFFSIPAEHIESVKTGQILLQFFRCWIDAEPFLIELGIRPVSFQISQGLVDGLQFVFMAFVDGHS